MNEPIPQGWKKEPLRNLSQVVSGGTPSRYAPEFWDRGTIPWVTPTDITGSNGRYLSETREHITELGLHSCSAKLLPSGSLLMTSRATLGEVRIAVGEVCTNQGFKSLIPFKGVDGRFLFYQIGLNKERYKGLGIGSTFLEVNKRDTERFEVLVAPEREQRRIAEILSTLDEAIEQTEALIAKHQQIKAGLMHDLFTRGVTPDGHLRPTREQAPDLYKESPLGWIPKEWEARPLSSVFSVSSGESLSEANRKPGEHQVYGGNGLAGTHDSFTFVEPRLIIGRVGEYCGNPYVTDPKSWVTDNALVVSFYRTTRYLQFWRLLLQRIDLRRFAYAAAQPVVTGGQLGKVMHPVISEDEQRQIEDRLLGIEQLVEAQQDHLSSLRQQKIGLMHDLLTGKIRVKIHEQQNTI